jgi:hypothetical protein
MRNARLFIGSVTLLAWFAISNHCVIDAAISAPAATSVHQDDCCPMHASTPTPPAQPKREGDAQVCCKNLPATAIKGARPLASFVAPLLTILFDRQDLFDDGRVELPSLCLDTGPPNALSFSELVLQRSLPVHAPPSIA